MKSIDYTDFRHVSKKEEEEEKEQKLKAPKNLAIAQPNRWWLCDDGQMPGAIMQQVGAIIKADSGRIDSYNKYAKLYGTYTPTFYNGYALANSGRPTAPMQDRLTYNIVQSCIDTITSQMQQLKPKPMFLTSAGDSKVQRRAKKLDSYIYGTYYTNKVYELQTQTFRDSSVFGEGITHPYIEAGKMKYERVLPYEILTDYLESHYGWRSTRSLFRVKNIDRTELCEMFPEHREHIWIMPGTAQYLSASNRSVGDTITVVEAWRLPVGGLKGLHVLVTPTLILNKEKYTDDFFPFSIQRYSPRLYGFYSQGLAEQLVPIQVELNRTLISIQRSLYLGGTHKIFVKNGSKIVKQHLDNAIGTILEYAGDTPPQYVVPQLVQPEIYSHVNNMIGMGYNLPGISQMAATSVKTPGVNSGRAMRTEQNINTERHKTVQENFQQSFIDLAQITVAVARKEYERGGELKSIKIPGKRFIQNIDWEDCSLEDDQFVLQIYPVSKLPNDPEGRISTIVEMMEAGILAPEVGRRLLDFPDLDAEENLANAQQDYLHKILDDIVDNGHYTAPDTDDNLEVAKKLVMEYIARGKLNELSQDKMDKLRQFNNQVEENKKKMAMALQPPPMPGQQAQGQGPPPANPMPTPQSELLPNVNQQQPQMVQ